MNNLKHFVVQGPSRKATLVMPKGDHISNYINKTKQYYENDLLDAIRGFNKTGVYVDVGAHYGNHTVFFALECPSTKVISIEANPITFSGLKQSIKVNNLGDKVTAHHLAIHTSWKRVRSSIPSPTNTGTGMVENDENGDVRACRLDEILCDIKNIAVIKSDAQYLDDLVIRSGLETIKKYKPLLSIEACTPQEVAILQNILDPLGYKRIGQYASSPTHIWGA